MTRPTSSGGSTLFGPTRADSLRRSVDAGAMPSSPRLKPQLGRAVFSPVGVGMPYLVLWDTLCSCEAYGMRPMKKEKMPSEESCSRRACL